MSGMHQTTQYRSAPQKQNGIPSTSSSSSSDLPVKLEDKKLEKKDRKPNQKQNGREEQGEEEAEEDPDLEMMKKMGFATRFVSKKR